MEKQTTLARELVLEMLLEVTAQKTYSHIVMRNVLDKYDYLEAQQKAFIKCLCEGTLERMIQLDYILNQFSNTPVNKMKPVIRNILRMGVYQILFMDKVPDSAACNEAVKLAEKKKFHNLKGFVNGVLRNVSRKKEEIKYPDQEKEPLRYLSVCYSMPEWILQLWLETYEIHTVEEMVKALLAEHPVMIRMTETITQEQRMEVLAEWEEKGIEVREHPYLSYAYLLRGIAGMKSLQGFEKGYFTVQDVSSMLAIEAAGIKEGNTVLDVCAAPGGKATHAALKLAGSGMVVARDVSEEKVHYVQENMDRLGLTNMKTEAADASICYEADIEKWDVVLADVPCSGLGIIGKKRDIKYRLSKEGLKEVVTLQKAIVSMASQYVKVGGVFLYTTCTIHKEENELMVKWMLDNLPLETESLQSYLPSELVNETAKSGYLQLLPGIHESDGFFIARFRKK